MDIMGQPILQPQSIGTSQSGSLSSSSDIGLFSIEENPTEVLQLPMPHQSATSSTGVGTQSASSSGASLSSVNSVSAQALWESLGLGASDAAELIATAGQQLRDIGSLDCGLEGPPTMQEVTPTSTPHYPVTMETNTQQEMPSSSEEVVVVRRRIKEEDGGSSERRCQICNDNASGLHYGVWSCEGCKAFFKRSIQGPVDYVCPASNTCTIDKTRRRCCQACRLRKCLEMGMVKGPNRKERTPRSAQNKGTKRKIETDGSKPAPRGPMVQPATQISTEYAKCLKEELLKPLPVNESEGRPTVHPVVEQLMRIDPPTRFSNYNKAGGENESTIMTALLKLADIELIDIINWAKALPGYSELSLNDQVHLLECVWMEILILGLCWRSMPSRGEILIFAPDIPMTRERCELAGISHLADRLRAVSAKFADLQLKLEELVLLKAIVLVNGDVNQLESQSKLGEMEQRFQEALQYTVQTRFRESGIRTSRLLGLLPHIRQCSMMSINHMVEMRNQGAVPFLDLLKEMLEAQNTMSNLPPPTTTS